MSWPYYTVYRRLMTVYMDQLAGKVARAHSIAVSFPDPISATRSAGILARVYKKDEQP